MSIKKISAILATLFFLTGLNAGLNSQSLTEGFKNPPESGKPRTWWHWTNSNITTEGITKDLEWMKRIGIGGLQLADVGSGQGQIVEKKVAFWSPEWFDAVRHTAAEADRLNLELALFSSAGWSLTGGPWVKPEQAMKKLVWSETNVKGPQKYLSTLPPVPSVEGPIQNLSRGTRPSPNESGFAKEFMVIAFPTPPDETDIRNLNPLITTSAGIIQATELIDNDLNTSTRIRAGNDKSKVWIQFSFDKPVAVKAVTLANRAGIPVGAIKAGNSPDDFTTLTILPGAQLYRAGKVATYSFPETKARNFRIEFTGTPLRPADVMAEAVTKPDSAYTFGEIKLHTGARINRWEDKAGFYHLFSYEPVASNTVNGTSAIDPSSIINLTSLVQPDGTLKWDVPAGDWTIMKFGYSLTGSKNRPPVPTGLGYEVDKLSKEYSLDYIRDYTDPLRKAMGTLYGKSFQYILLDSWEAGMQNWTDNMTEEFQRRRGYDPSPYLPCLTGRVVANSEISDRFLWDFRRTLADMFAENHYGVITDYLNNQGIKTYAEASGVSLEILEDALLCKKYVDIPMGEFWRGIMHPDLMYYQDVRGAASAAHIYGKKIVGAEAFTGGGFDSPYTLKKVGDYWFTQGINRFIFHTSAHQPLDTKPGNTMVGTHINRNITWAEQAAPFMDYLARNSYMLQQGLFVADLVYLLNEGAPSTMPIWGSGLLPSPPEGFDYDYINADALITRMSVDSDGKLLLPDGMSYEVLILPDIREMTLPVLRKLHELVSAGASIAGPKPLRTPGLTDFPACNIEFSELTSDIWGDLDGVSRTKRSFGKGKIYWNVPPALILQEEGIEKDLDTGISNSNILSWIHRRSSDTDFWFIVNRTDSVMDLNMKFRISGREAELWDPVTGNTEVATYRFSKGNTVVPLKLGQYQSVYVVFNKKALENSLTIPVKEPVLLSSINGPWQLRFPAGLGAPETASLPELESLTTSTDQGIKYFSGTVSYSNTFSVPARWLKEEGSIIIDLGEVGDLAEVIVNGHSAGIVWCDPFSTDITPFLKKGDNTLEINVTNQWTNRLAGDQRAEPGSKVLNASLFMFRARTLDNSGLIGPVKLYKQ
ncbi:MAG TPA: glycosyl hydrolase [Bacteroidales bacterium]|nr:glycosyl hydrolase [Bacteroidales bacterium]